MIQPVALIILDGWGYAPNGPGNAVSQADTRYMNSLWERYPHTFLDCSGLSVGLPEGQMGNSEVGHLTIGSGRVIYQDLVRVSKAIEDGSFFRNPALVKAVEHVKARGSKLHLLGLLGPGGVHSHIEHLEALLRLAHEHGLTRVEVHPILDGRDTPPSSGIAYLRELERFIRELGTGRIATVSGRYYTMDRDKRWERTEKAYRMLVQGEGESGDTADEVVQRSYARGTTDEFVLPAVVGRTPEERRESLISPHDAVIFFNFRSDRTRQITRALVMDEMPFFNRGPKLEELLMVTMTEYEEGLPVDIAFPADNASQVLAQVLSEHGIRQFHTAETEKYAHVTFFLNGGREELFPLEDRELIPSPRVPTYDLQPEMSAPEVCRTVLRVIERGEHPFIIVNFANGDMVGHTGVIPAAVKAIETVDRCMGQIAEAIVQRGGAALVTADHGNAEEMIDPETGGVKTAHTTNPVPFLLVGEKTRHVKLRDGGALYDLAPTILQLLEIPAPEVMTGTSLIVSDKSSNE